MTNLLRCQALCLCSVVFIAGCSSGAGERWPTSPIEAADIVDSENIWIVTDKAELIYKKNGATASRQFAGEVSAVDFITREIGWALMKTGAVMQTRDGGSDWNEIGKVQNEGKGREPFWTPDRMMQFADEQAGWIAASDSIFRTVDGGRTWSAVNFAGDGPVSGWVVVGRNEVWCVTWSVVVHYTFDGGVTWNIEEPQSGRSGHESYPRAIARDTGGRIWTGNLLSKPTLYVSDMDGEAWSERRFPAEAGTIRVTSIQFAPDGTGRLVYRRIIDTDQPIHSSITISTDSGETWKPMPIAGVPFEALRVEFTDALVGFLIGASDIAKTEDRGRNWKVIYRQSPL